MHEDETRSDGQGWRSPLALGAGGLALLLAGYFLLSAGQPRWPGDERGYAQWQELRDMAARDPQQKELTQKLDRMAPPAPLRPLGVVAFWAGLLLFIAAGVRMYRHKPPPEATADEEGEVGTENPEAEN
jgi:hypothetical protein